MHSGSCLCGASKIFISGPPTGVVTCHCRDCRKVSGSVYSVNWIVPSTRASVVGHAISSVAVTAASGSRITGYFCSGCGTTLYRASDGAPGLLFVKAGVLDSEAAISAHPPVGESFVGTRVGWVPKIGNVSQAPGHCQLPGAVGAGPIRILKGL